MSPVIRFQVPQADVAWLKAGGFDPTDFARDAFRRALKRERVREAFAELRRIPMRRSMRAEQMVREDRDSH